MKVYNCKNCGAEVSHTFNHRCEYCGGILDFNAPEDKIVLCKPEELSNIVLREVYKPIGADRTNFIFSGYKLPKPVLYEAGDDATFISSKDDFMTKCSFGISISDNELYQYGREAITRELYKLNVDYSEIDNIVSDLLIKGYIHDRW